MARRGFRTASGRPLGDIGQRIIERYKGLGPAAADAAMLELDREVKMTLSRPGRGIVYKRGRKTHQASAPGDPPASDTGDLRRKTGWVRMGLQAGRGIVRRYGAATKVGLWMERGTRHIKARPWLAPSVARARGKMAAAVRRVLSGG